MNKNRKKYVEINNHTSSDQNLLDNVQSDEEEYIEELMNDSDTEFFANDEGIENIVPDSDNTDILTPEVSIHIVKENEKEQEKNLKSKLEEVQFQWRLNIIPNIREECNLVGEVCHQLKEISLPLEVYEKDVNLDNSK